jgi:hypothetical protein
MLNTLRNFALGGLLCVLTACAGGLTEVSGPVAVGKAYTVTLPRAWNKYADSSDSYWTRGDVLTQDGRALNEIRLVGQLKPGDYIVRPQRKELPTPTYRADMSELELAEFVASSVGALGYEQVKSADVRPQNFGGAEGVAMRLSALTSRGLRMQGDARLARVGDKLNVMVFMAPELHFYGAYKDEVSKIFDSATLQ